MAQAITVHAVYVDGVFQAPEGVPFIQIVDDMSSPIENTGNGNIVPGTTDPSVHAKFYNIVEGQAPILVQVTETILEIAELVNTPETPTDYSLYAYVRPEWFGAVGDGITDDTDAFLLAVASGVHRMLGTYGKTYILSRQILFPSGYTWEGGFCTIKRADGRSSLLTATATVGTNTLTVADGSIFKIGDKVALKNTTGANSGFRWNQLSNWASGQTTITNVSGNVITLADNILGTGDGVVTTTWAIGSTLFSVNGLFVGSSSSNENIQILDTTFDGNKANNDFNYFWALSSSINLIAYKTVIKGCYFTNSPNENIFVGGPAVIENNEYLDLNGSFVHIGVNFENNHEDVRVLNNRGYNSNIKESATETNHSEGVITMSAGPYNVWIEGNHFKKANLSRFVAPINPTNDIQTTEDKIWMLRNKIEDMLGIFICNLTLGSIEHNLRFEGNECINAGHIYFQPTETPNTFRQGTNAAVVVNIDWNTFQNTQIYAANVANISISNNTQTFTEDYVASVSSLFVGSALFVQPFNAVINNNIIKLPITGVVNLTRAITCFPVAFSGAGGYIHDSGGLDVPYIYGQNISICNNVITNAGGSIVTVTTNNSTAVSGGQRIGWKISGNIISMSPTNNANGIIATAGCVISGNEITGFGGTGTSGIYVFGASSANFATIQGAIVKDNFIFGTLTQSILYGMHANNGYNNVIIGNIVTNAVTSGGAGSGNVVSGNTTLPIANQAIPRQALFQYPERY